MNFVVVFLTFHNVGELRGREKAARGWKNRYTYSRYGRISIRDEESLNEEAFHIDKNRFFYYANILSELKTEDAQLIYSDFVNDEGTETEIRIDFTDDYMQGTEKVLFRDGPGVWIGHGVERQTNDENGTLYIKIGEIDYKIKGIYKNNSAVDHDTRIVIPYDLFSAVERKAILDNAAEKSGQGVFYYIASDRDLSESAVTLKEQLERDKDVFDFEIEDYSNESDMDLLTGKIQRITVRCMEILALISLFFVLRLWIIRNRKNVLLCKIWGMQNYRIALISCGFLIRCIFTAAVFALLLLGLTEREQLLG